jgi:hypothetical protein
MMSNINKTVELCINTISYICGASASYRTEFILNIDQVHHYHYPVGKCFLLFLFFGSLILFELVHKVKFYYNKWTEIINFIEAIKSKIELKSMIEVELCQNIPDIKFNDSHPFLYSQLKAKFQFYLSFKFFKYLAKMTILFLLFSALSFKMTTMILLYLNAFEDFERIYYKYAFFAMFIAFFAIESLLFVLLKTLLINKERYKSEREDVFLKDREEMTVSFLFYLCILHFTFVCAYILFIFLLL